eukprot:TRINITY_DN4177_c0_g1_i3.p1 TRINITY_DN4177_c0_g1~~TRINITY_DN4177_c0_g1_i3.p1  ORF type:complete len:200 (+),score=48.89 TRINITY_DN4177_c0_g1_i3:45-644(+)
MAGVRILSLLGLAVAVMGINFIVEPDEPRCFKKHVEAGDYFSGEMISSGMTETLVKVKVRDDKGFVIYLGENESEHYFGAEINKTSVIHMCVESLDSYQKVISMSFRTYHEGLRLTVDEEAKDPLVKDLHEMYGKFIEILSSQETFQIRASTHKNLVKQAKRHLRWSLVLKSLVVLIIAILQIAVIMRIFRGVKYGIEV